MLDLTKAAKAMQGMSQHLNVDAQAARQRLEVAQNLLVKAAAEQEKLVELQESWRDRTLFNAATPIEPLDDRTYITAPPAAHTVFATDGSQISPNHHEIAYCYLLNVGTVMLHYGQSRHPVF